MTKTEKLNLIKEIIVGIWDSGIDDTNSTLNAIMTVIEFDEKDGESQ